MNPRDIAAELRVALYDVLHDQLPPEKALEAIRALAGTGPTELGALERIIADTGEPPTLESVVPEFSRACDFVLAGTGGEGVGEVLRLKYLGPPEWEPD